VKYFLLFVLITFGACTFIKKQAFTEEKPVWKKSFDTTALARQLKSTRLTRDFYLANGQHFVWQDSSGLTSVGDSMFQTIRDAQLYGLIPADYHLDEITELLESASPDEGSPDLDVLLTDAFFTLRFHLSEGRINKKSLEKFDYSNRSDSTAFVSLSMVLRDSSLTPALRSVEPGVPIYQKLKLALTELLAAPSEDSVFIKKHYQLIANLERWRMQAPLAERHIVVNVPSFMLKAVEGDSIFLESKVIIGKPETPTPELESVIRSFIIYPYWHVPRSIIKEILPQIQADSLYLRKHNYQVLDYAGTMLDATTLDWQSFDPETFPYVLRQREGSENTMGVLKFVFANNYNVYLHDTNAKRLFNREQRALSHGCVRVNKAVQLAHYLAKDDDTYVSPEDLDQYLLLQRRLEVQVVKPINLYLQYFTCVEEDGKIVFYDDLYKKDKKMFMVLTNQIEEELASDY
jgi:L,D-transpeptidase YcbB